LIHRIRGRDVFARVARDGTRIRGTTLWCTHLPDPSIATTQVAFAVGRAVGPAVTRNRVRRRLRAVLGELDHDGQLPGGRLLIGARPGTAERTFDSLREELRTLVERIPTTSTSTPPPAPR
jgi:ribonuclease P protein component